MNSKFILSHNLSMEYSHSGKAFKFFDIIRQKYSYVSDGMYNNIANSVDDNEALVAIKVAYSKDLKRISKVRFFTDDDRRAVTVEIPIHPDFLNRDEPQNKISEKIIELFECAIVGEYEYAGKSGKSIAGRAEFIAAYAGFWCKSDMR